MNSNHGTPKGASARARKAGLQFPVGRIHRKLKETTARGMRVGAKAAVFTAAVLEYLMAEILELSGNQCCEQALKRITPRHIQLAIRIDDEFDQLVHAVIPGGGVLPNVRQQQEVVVEGL